jgi:plastocyanin
MPTQHAAPVKPVPAAVPAPMAAAQSRPMPAPVIAQAAVPEPSVAPMPAAAPAATPPPPSIAPPPRHGVRHAKSKTVAAKEAVAPASIAVAPASVQISGQVDLLAARGQQVVGGERADTVVYFVPAHGAARARGGHYTIYTSHRDFSPQAMVVPQGSTVTFVNLDDVRHNVFSVTPGAAFDLGYQGSGEKASHVFSRAGIILVSCNVHHAMELDMLVLPTPYAAKVAADGHFTLSGLPVGTGTLHFWNPRAAPASQTVTLPMADALRQKLLAVKPRMTTQLNTAATP